MKAYAGLTVFTGDLKMPIISDAIVVIEEGKIVYVGPEERGWHYLEEAEEFVKLDGKLIIPGMANNNVFLNSFLYLLSDHPSRKITETFLSFLNMHIPSDFELSAKWGAVTAVKNGVTHMIGMFIWEKGMDPEKVLKTLEDIPVRMIASPFIKLKDLNEDLLRLFKSYDLIPTVKLDESLEEKLPQLARFEETSVVRYLIPNWDHLDKLFLSSIGKKAIEISIGSGIFSPNVQVVHGGGFSTGDLDVLAVRNVEVVKSPRFEYMLGSKSGDIQEYVVRSMRLSLGTSVFDLSPVNEVKLALFTEFSFWNSTKVLKDGMYKLLFQSSYDFYSNVLGSQCGRIREGYEATFMVVNTLGNIETLDDFMDFLLRKWDPSLIDRVLVEGEEIYVNKQIRFVDEYQLMQSISKKKRAD